MLRIPDRFFRVVFFVCFISAFFSAYLGIAQNIVVSAADPRHETLNQRVISVLFDTNIASATTAGWSVTINGTPVPVNSVLVGGGPRVFVTFDATPIGGVPFLRPGETLRVSYDAAAGNTFTSSGPEIISFANVQSKNNFANLGFPPASPICSEMEFFNLTNYGTPDLCAPVLMDFRQVAYKISLRIRNSSAFAIYPIVYTIDWGDATTNNYLPVQSDLAGNPSPGFINAVDPAFGGNPAIILTARPSKAYPATTTPAPDICSWDARITPRFDGNSFCNSIAQNTTFASYDTDNANTGALNLPPSVPGSNLVCVGSNVNMRFTDQTQLNCRLAVESGVPNNLTRHIRIVYGSQNLATNIPDVRVGGVPVTANNAAGTHLFPANPVLGGAPGYVVTGPGFPIGTPDPNGVIELPTPVTVSTALTYMQLITTTAGINQVVGDRFFVRLEYWDVCNPYNDPNGIVPSPFTAPVSIENFIDIIGKPNPPTVNNPSVCETTGAGSYLITATGVGAGTLTYTWYRDAAITQVLQAASTDNTFNPATEGPGPLVPTTVTGSQTFNRFVTVTQSSNNCASDPQTITIRIDDQNTPGTIAHPLGASPITICSSDDPVAFTSTAPGSGGGPGGTFTYQWQQATAVGGPYSSIVGATSATFDPTPAQIAAGRFFRRQLASGNCPPVNSNVIEFVINTPPTGGTIAANQTICVGGDPANLTSTVAGGGGNGTPSYQWLSSTVSGGPYSPIGGATLATYNPPAGLLATTFFVRQNTSGVCVPGTALSNEIQVTVEPTLNAGTIGNDQTICSGQTPAGLTGSAATGGNGGPYTYLWQQSAAAGGPFVNATGINNTQNYTPPSLTATTFYRRRASGGTCPAVDSNVIQITVNPLPTANNPTGGGAVCSGNPAPDIVWTGLTGTAPFTISYTITQNPGAIVTPVGPLVEPTNTFTIDSPSPVGAIGDTFAYKITAITDANGCSASAAFLLALPSRTVTIGGTAPAFDTAPSITPTAVCQNGASTTDPQLNFSLNPASTEAGSYTLTYRIDGAGPFNKNFTANLATGDPVGLTAFSEVALNNTAPNPHVIRLVSITTPSGCQSISNTDLNFVVNPVPAAPTAPVNGTSCSTGSSVQISVTPQASTIVQWFTDAAGTVAAVGTTAGAQNQQFTPTANTTQTYFAFSQSTTAPTLCRSTAGIAVQHTVDISPAAAAAGPPQAVCTTTAILAATPANNGGTGTWTVPGSLAYFQNFSSFASGTTSSTAFNGWTRDVSNANAFPQQPPGGYFEVRGALGSGRFEAQNTNGNLTGGAAIRGPVFWNSPSIDISGFASAVASVALDNVSNDLDGGADEDYIRVSYSLNGGAFVTFENNGFRSGNFADITATSNAVSGSTLQIRVEVSANAATETIAFDNIVVRLPGSTVAFSDANSATASVTGLTQNAPGTTPAVNTLTWTVRSQLGVCANTTSNVVITVNPLPLAVNQTPQVCEDIFGGGTRTNFDLTTLNGAVSAAAPGITVEWFFPGPPPAGAITPANTPQTITNGKIYHFRLTNTITGCQSSGTVTFTVNPLPVANDQTFEFCENSVGLGQATGINLTAFENAITGGVANRNVDWFEDAAFTTLIAPGAGAGQEQNYFIATSKTIFARVTNTVSSCFQAADVTLNLKLRPVNNPIVGNSVVCTDPNNIVLYQVNPTLNPGSNYTWTVTGLPPAAVQLFGGGGTNSPNFFVLLKFPAIGTVNLTMQETLNGCTGNVQNFSVTVASAPPAVVIGGPTAVCTNQTGVVYSVPPNPTSIFTWTVAGATIVGPSSGPNLNTITVDYGVVTPVTVRVTETSSSGCAGPPSEVIVNVSPRPIMTSSATSTVCSGNTPSLVFAANEASTFAWRVTSVTGVIGGTALGNTGTGNLSQVLINTSGAIGSVSYEVTPTSTISGCAGSPQAVVVTVNPAPLLVSNQAKTVCSNQAIGYEILLSPATLPTGTTFSWPDPDGAGPATGQTVPAGSAGTIHINDVIPNLTNAPITVTYVVTPTSGSGCVGAPQNVVITVNPQPILSPTLGVTRCSDLGIGLNLAVAGGSVAAVNYNITGRAISAGLTPAGTNAVVPATAVAANYLATDAFTNTSALPLTVAYTVVPVSAAGCAGAPVIVTATIDPEPVVSGALDRNACSDVAIGLILNTAATSVAATTYNVTGRSIGPGLIAGGSNATVPSSGQPANFLASDVYTNTGAAPAIVTYTVVPISAAGCVGDPRVITVTINPEPVVSNSLNAAVCSRASIGLVLNTNGTSVAAFNYNVTAVNISAGLTPDAGNVAVPATGVAAGYLTSDKYTNITNSALTVTYTVVPVSAASCLGDLRDIVITINPQPIISTGLDATVCSDIATGLTLAVSGTSVAAASYNVISRTVSPGLTASGGNAFVPANGVAANYLANDVFTNTGGTSLTVTYTVAGVSSAGCVGASQVITMTVNPEPVMATGLDNTICSNQAINLVLNTNGASVAAATYNITARTIAGGLTPGPGNVAVPALGVAATYLQGEQFANTGPAPLNVTYTVVPVSSAGCLGNPLVITIGVNPEPVVATTLNATVCSDQNIGLTLNTNGVSVGAASYNITAVTVAGGLTAAVSNAAVPATSVPAGYLNADRYTNLTANPLNVTYTVVGVSAAGCASASRNIVITINPEPVVSTTLNTTVCSDQNIGLILNTNGTSVAAANYNIVSRTLSGSVTGDLGNAAVSANGVAANYLANDRYNNVGSLPGTVTFVVVPVAASGCLGNPQSIVITIEPEPVVATTLNSSTCSDQAVNLTLNTNGSSVAAATYNITAISIAGGLTASAGNAAVPASGVPANYLAADRYTNTGSVSRDVTYTVVGVSAAGCLGDPRVITMTILPEPVVSNALNATVCSDAATGLTLNTNGTSVAALNYNVVSKVVAGGLVEAGTNSPVPATGVAVNYLANDRFTNTGGSPLTVVYTVEGVSSAACVGDQRSITITINPEPVIATTLNATVCSDQVTNLTLNTNGTSVAAANYNVTARTVSPGLTAAGTNAVVPATGVAANYLVNDRFTNTGASSLTVTYTVVGVSADGCVGNPQVITITIDPEPVVSATLDKTVCSDTPIALTLSTNGSSVAAANYDITARSVAVGLSPAVGNAAVPASAVGVNYLANDEFTNTGNAALTVGYTVVPISADGCVGDPRIITVTINPEPVVSTSLNATVCSDQVTGLVLNTNGLSVAAASYNITASAVSPGLIAAGGNAVVPATGVAANFVANDRFNNVGGVPLTVTYTVVPVSAAGCVGSPQVITMTINPEPVVSTTLNTAVCSDLATGLVLNTNGTSVAAANYNVTAISVGAGLVSAGTNAAVPAVGVNANYLGNDVFTNTTNAPIAVTYTVVGVSAAGCVGNPEVITVTINPEPVVSSTLDKSVCSDLPIALTLNTNGTSVAAADYNVTNETIAAGLVAGGANAVVPATGVAAGYLVNNVFTNNTNGPLTVTYTVVPRSAGNCFGNSRVITVTINPEPVLSPSLDRTACSDTNIGLVLNTNGTSVAAGSYNITSRTIAPGLTPNAANVVVPANNVAANYLSNDQFTNTGNAPLTVTYDVVPVSAAGCLGNSVTVTITVDPEPVVANGLDRTECSDLPIGLTLNTNGTSVGAATYNISSITVAGGLTANAGNAAVPATGVAANYLAGHIFTNTTTGSLTVSYVVVPVSAAGCLGDARTIVVTIAPEPVISAGLDRTACSDVASGLVIATLGTSVPAASYNITGISVDPGLTAAGTNAAVPATGVNANYLNGDQFTNTGAAPLTVTYTIVPVSAAGCLGNARNVVVTINPEPVASTLMDRTACSDVGTGLNLNTNGSSVAAATWNITARTIAPSLTPGVGNGIVPATGVASNYLAADQFTNTTGGPLQVTYTVVPVSGAGCVGSAQVITVTIEPEPVLANTLNRTVCSDQVSGLVLNTNGTSVAAANYNITSVIVPPALTVVSAAAVPATGVADNYLATDTYRNTTTGPLTVDYTVVPVSAAGCLGNPLVIKVNVNPEPVVAVVSPSVCSDQVIGLSLTTVATSVPAATYNITAVTVAPGLTAAGTNAVIPGNGVSASYLANDAYTNPGNNPLTVTYTVVPISAATCLGDPVVITVTINPEPVLSNALDRTVCSDLAGGVVLNTNGTSVAAASYNVISINVSGGLTPAAGNRPIANGAAANYLINDIFTNKTNSALPVTYRVVPVSAGGCVGDPLDVVLTVDPEPVVDPALATRTICSRAVTGITLNTNGVSVAAANYNITLVSQDAGLTGTPTTGAALAANALANDNFENVTAVPLKVVYQVVPVAANGCLGDPFVITVNVNPEPVVNPNLDNAVCSRENGGIILSTNGTSAAANAYRLVGVVVPGTITADPANTLVGTTSGINMIRNDRYTNLTSGPVVVVYEIRGISLQGCEGQSEFINLTINPEPILVPGAVTLCSDVPSGIVISPAVGSVAINQYELKAIAKATALVAGGSNAGLGLYNTANFLAGDTFTNTTNGPLVVTYTIVPIAAGCRGSDQVVVFTVNPAPAVQTGLDRTVCNNEVGGIVFATAPTSVAAPTYNIISVTIAPGLTQTAGNTGARSGVLASEVQNDQFQNLTSNPLTVTYRVEPVSGPGCLGPQRDIVLRVEPNIVAAPINNLSDICSGVQTNIDLQSPTNPTSGPVTFSYVASISAGTGVTGFIAALSNLPEGTIISDQLVNNSDNVATVRYRITPVAIGAKGGVGCTGNPVDVFVNIDPKPKLSAVPLIQSVCEGVATNITLNSTTVPYSGNVRFEVTSVVATGGVTGFTPVSTLIAPGSTLADVLSNPTITDQTVTYTLLPRIVGGPGCVGDPVVLTITVKPRPTVTAVVPAPICTGDIIDIDLNPDVANTVCTWTVSAPGITGASPGSGNKIFQTLFNNTFVPATATYTITPQVNGCAGTPLVLNIVVNPKPDVIGVPTTLNVCDGVALNVPLNGNVAGTTYSWTVTDPSGLGVPLTGSGSTINISPILNNTGVQAPLTFSITPSANGCDGNIKVLLVNVAPRLSARFLSSNASICLGSSEFLIVQLDGQAPFTLVYNQNDGTTSTDITLTNVGNVRVIQVTPPTTGTYTYTLKTVTDVFNCPLNIAAPAPDQISTVNVGDTNSNFTVLTPTPTCGPRTFQFQYNQVAGVQYTWQWFDGSPDSVYVAAVTQPNTIVRHRFTNPSPVGNITFNVTLRTQLLAPFPGCFKATVRPITIFPSMVVNVFPNRSEICGNEQVQFFNQSVGVTSHRWFWRLQGTTAQNDVRTTSTVVYTLTNTTSMTPLVYEIVYQANNGNCPVPDVVMPIIVHRSVVADFTVPASLPSFTGAPVSVLFTNNSNPNDPAIRYEWNFGLDSNPLDFTGQTPPSVIYGSPGFRTITLRATNTLAEAVGLTCADTESKTINIQVPPLTADFVAGPPAACVPATISVTQSTLGGNKNTWEIVDQVGNVAGRQFNVNTPSFLITAPGDYTIILKVENTLTGQELTISRGIFTVVENPIASFQARPTTVFVPDDEVTTFNFSTGATGYEWQFGDGTTSFLEEPTHTYQIEGVYEMMLIALRDQAGVTCRDTTTQTITAKQGGVTKVPNAFTPNPSGPTGGAQPGGGTGAINDVFLPIVKGALEFNLQIFDRWGNLIFESNNSGIGWDGYDKNGRLMPNGVYVYKLTVRLSDEQRTTQIGDVTLIR